MVRRLPPIANNRCRGVPPRLNEIPSGVCAVYHAFEETRLEIVLAVTQALGPGNGI